MNSLCFAGTSRKGKVEWNVDARVKADVTLPAGEPGTVSRLVGLHALKWDDPTCDIPHSHLRYLRKRTVDIYELGVEFKRLHFGKHRMRNTYIDHSLDDFRTYLGALEKMAVCLVGVSQEAP